jgi:hypothetical protein
MNENMWWEESFPELFPTLAWGQDYILSYDWWRMQRKQNFIGWQTQMMNFIGWQVQWWISLVDKLRWSISLVDKLRWSISLERKNSHGWQAENLKMAGNKLQKLLCNEIAFVQRQSCKGCKMQIMDETLLYIWSSHDRIKCSLCQHIVPALNAILQFNQMSKTRLESLF